jgi:hypothetical protein
MIYFMYEIEGILADLGKPIKLCRDPCIYRQGSSGSDGATVTTGGFITGHFRMIFFRLLIHQIPETTRRYLLGMISS